MIFVLGYIFIIRVYIGYPNLRGGRFCPRDLQISGSILVEQTPFGLRHDESSLYRPTSYMFRTCFYATFNSVEKGISLTAPNVCFFVENKYTAYK